MESFDNYVKKYDMNDPDINYKYYHSYRVMNIIKELATRMKLSNKDIELASVIGLLHDIGRFEQDKLYDSFIDNEMDHGDYGVKVLKEINILKEFDIEETDYEIIYKAIKNHNKFKIENGLSERELFFAKLIRDADKLDILYALGNEQIKKELRQDDKMITKEIEKDFFENRPGNLKYCKNKNDGLVITLCYIYDINFKETYQIILENKYYNKIFKRINHKEIFEKYFNYTQNYIKERIDKNVR